MLGTFAAVGYLSTQPFMFLVVPPPPFAHQEVAQLAYAGVSFALAIAVAVLLPAVLRKVPAGLPSSFLFALGVSIIGFPPLFGIVCIAEVIVSLTGPQIDFGGVGIFYVCLWGAVVISILSVRAVRMRVRR
jgi:hypothetical protein